MREGQYEIPAPESEIKQEAAPEFKNEKVEVGDFVLEPVDREANKFHFLSNLAEWHPSCYKEDNKIWEKEAGGFSKEEKEVIENFGDIMKKYPQWGKDGLTATYLTAENQKQRQDGIEKTVSLKDDREKIERCLSVIESPFSRIWEKNEPRLLMARQEFIENLQNFEVSGTKEQLENDLNNFFGQSAPENKLKTIFLMQEDLGNGGTAFPGAVGLQRLDQAPSLPVFYHEVIHARWEQNSSYKKLFEEAERSLDMQSADSKTIDKIKKAKLSAREILNETITDSFLPHGCLEKYFLKEQAFTPEQMKNRPEKFLIDENQDLKIRLREMLSKNVKSLSERYVQDGKKADKDYFKEVINIISSSVNQF